MGVNIKAMGRCLPFRRRRILALNGEETDINNMNFMAEEEDKTCGLGTDMNCSFGREEDKTRGLSLTT